MSILTILLFFVYTYGFGFASTYVLKNHENLLERVVMRIGVGLGLICLFGVLLNYFRLPIDWKIFLLVSLIAPIYYFIQKKSFKIPYFKLTKSNLNIIIIFFIFLATLFMYEKGSFSYPYLEDDDSWHHAQSVKYISIEKTAYEIKEFNVLSFIDPYPPGYGILMAILHQTSPSISWTLKFFNSLIISLGILFFYFFVKEFTGSKNKALFSTFVLAAIPCYLSHFIWAHSLIITLFFPLMYCIEMMKYDSKWIIPSSVLVSSIMLVQPEQPIKLFIMVGLYAFIKLLYSKKHFFYILCSGIIGFLLSLFWWFNKAGSLFSSRIQSVLSYPDKYAHTISSAGSSVNFLAKLKLAFPYNSGTATRTYSFNDFFFAQKQNMINNPIGVGVVICLLLFISLVYIIIKYKSLTEQKNQWILVTLLWLIFTFLGVNSMTFKLPLGLSAFRFWMLFAIPVAILLSEGLWLLTGVFQKVGFNKLSIIVLVVIGIIFTSAYPKYIVNTAKWPAGATWVYMQDQNGRVSSPELEGYLWLKTLPVNTRVFAFTVDRSNYIIGFDKFMCVWCKEDMGFQKGAIDKTADELNNWLKRKKYEYITIGGKEAMEFGINKTSEKINEFTSSGLFQPVHNTNGVIILKVL